MNTKILYWISAAIFAASFGISRVAAQCVQLLESLGGLTCIPISGGAGTFIAYFVDSMQWLMNIAVGVCALWIIVSGIQIMLAGGDSGKRSEAISHMFWSIGGLLILGLSGFILRTLNSLFFT